MEPKVIKNEQGYHSILQEAERLVALDPAAGSKDAERLELFTVLVEDYERRKFPFETPDPIEAIEFRMNEQGLRQKDLVPLIGSRSRVSEVLARKRPLTVQMIRALSTGLGIPLDALVMEPSPSTVEAPVDFSSFNWKQFPLKEMGRRGWLASLKTKANASIEEIVQAFLSQVASGARRAVLYRRNFRGEEVDQKVIDIALRRRQRRTRHAMSCSACCKRLTDNSRPSCTRTSRMPGLTVLAVRATRIG